MPTGEIVAIISLVVAILGLIGTAYIGLFKFARIESRVELLWSFLMRRGVADALIGGVMEKSSPLRLKVQALEQHKALTEKARAFYLQAGHKMNDIGLIEELERRYGVELGAVASEHQMNAGGCLVALTFLLRPDMPLFKQFDTQDWHSRPVAKGVGAS